MRLPVSILVRFWPRLGPQAMSASAPLLGAKRRDNRDLIRAMLAVRGVLQLGALWNPSAPICEVNGLIITRDRSVLRRSSIGQIEHYLVHVIPPPSLWRIVALDDRMAGRMEMLGCMSVR